MANWGWIAIGLLLAVAVAAGAAWWITRRRARREPRPRGPRRGLLRARTVPRHPIVLAHGLFGFDELKLGKGRVEYWKGVPRALRRMGAEVAVPRFGSIAGVETRAAQLADVVRTLPSKKVNVVAHSMGGVDARYAIARMGIADRVAAVVTVATPHRGTPLADIGATALSPLLRDRAGASARSSDGGAPRPARKPVLDLGGIRDARPDAMRRLNRRIRNDDRVHYASVIGAVEGVGGVNPLLVPGYLFLSGKAGRNDGVVPAESQAWGEVLARVEADHWAVVGWSKSFDAPDFYAQILRELAARGF